MDFVTNILYTSMYNVYLFTAPGNNTEVYVHQATDYIKTAITGANIGQLSAEQYTAMYLLANNTGLHIGFDGQEPFISVTNTMYDLPAITSVTFDGIGLCSCEGDPPCTSKYVTSDWLICAAGRYIFKPVSSRSWTALLTEFTRTSKPDDNNMNLLVWRIRIM